MMGERGSVVPLGAAAVVVAAMMMVILVEVGVRAIDRAEAQSAADMAALAAVVEGRAGAVDLAQRNGAALSGYADDGVTVWVEVSRGHARAQARASYG